jgi:hypothetical protein
MLTAIQLRQDPDHRITPYILKEYNDGLKVYTELD